MNQLRICCQLPQVVGSEEITGAVRREIKTVRRVRARCNRDRFCHVERNDYNQITSKLGYYGETAR